MSRARMELGMAAIVVVAVIGYATVDNDIATSVIYVGAILAASVAAWVGAERAPAGCRLVGRLIAAGLSLTAVAEISWEVLDRTGAGTDVSIADPWWVAGYVALGAALWVVLRQGKEDGDDDLTFAIDVVTVVVVSVLVFWSVSIESIVADRNLDVHVRIVWAAYPVADAVLLALVVRVLMSRRARDVLDPSFAIGIGIWLAADVAYLQSPDGAFQVMMDAGWMVAPALLARSVWRLAPVVDAPSSAAPSSSVPQLVIAIGPLLVPPALELFADLRGRPDQPVQLLIGSATLILLALVRTSRLMRSEERARRDVAAARDAALEASRAKSMFLATMSHEIRTPLTLVLGAAEILEDTALDEFQLGLVKRMHRSGQVLSGLVDGILDFSRIEAGHIDLAATEFDLHRVVDDLADVYAASAAERGVAFGHQVEPGVPHTVVGDAGRLRQVLGNLLDNALKFTPEGRVSLTVRPVRTMGVDAATGTDAVEYAVADTGIGICPEDLPSVFESFRQVDGSTTRRFGGTGLGLAICKELTELMGGSLTATSEPGHGSVFVVRLPRRDVHGSGVAEPPLAALPAEGVTSGSGVLQASRGPR